MSPSTPSDASDGSAGTPRASVTTSLHVPPPFGATGTARRSKPSAQTSTCASNTGRGDHHDHVRFASRSTSARTGAASRDARIDCGSTSPTCPPGRTARTATARNSAAALAYGPPPWRLAPRRVVVEASCERNGGLPSTTSTSPARELRPQSVAVLQHDVATPGQRVPRQDRVPRRRRRSRRASVRPRRPTIVRAAATRNRPSPHAGSSTVIRWPGVTGGSVLAHHVVDQPVRRRVAAALLARLRRQHAPSVGCPECKRPPAGSSRSSVTTGPPSGPPRR